MVFGRISAYLGDNAVAVAAKDAEAKLRTDHPQLLLHDEKVVLAFHDRGGAGRDSKYMTSVRIIIKNVQGISGKAVSYQSIPYSAIKAFAVQSVGGGFDTDCELKLWTSGQGVISMDFTADVDILGINRHLNEMCLIEGGIGAHVPDGAQATAAVPERGPQGISKFLDMLGDNASQINAAQCEAQFKTEPKILMDDEKVEMAFKCGRDSFLMTSKRLLKIDVQGFTGKRVEYLSVLWKCLRAFSIETASNFLDRDVDMMIFTDIKELPRIEQDFRKGHCDVYAIQKYFADKMLGVDSVAASEHAISMQGQPDYGSGSIFAWCGDDSRMIDATMMDRQYHSNPPILQRSERVEMAFKGRRDLTLFTTKRLLVVDMKGFSSLKKAEYITIPWSTVTAFGVRSAGSFMDKDSEMMIWTDINDVFFPPKQGDNPPPPPIPRNSFLEMDFQKDKVDLMAIHRYLSERCIRIEGGGYLSPEVSVAPEIMAASPPGGVERFLDWLGDNARTVDHNALDQQLHSTNPMLQVNEHIVHAFQVGRDLLAFTTKRVLIIDVQGWSGKRVEYTSIPYTSIRAFSTESAGSWDRDSEVKFCVKTYWWNGRPGSTFKQDLRKGRADIVAMQSFLAAQVIGWDNGSRTSATQWPTSSPTGLDGFLQWIGDDAHAIDAGTVNTTLHTSPPILQSDETVELAFKVGRDMFVCTTKRVLIVDVQGFTGKRVEYTSFPLKYVHGFEVKSAGSIGFLNSAHAMIYTDVPGHEACKQDLSKSTTDIWAIQTHFTEKLLKRDPRGAVSNMAAATGKGAGKGGGYGAYASSNGMAPPMAPMAGAVGQPAPVSSGVQQMSVQVPPGVYPGATLQIQTPSGPFSVVVPPGVQEGQNFVVEVPSVPAPYLATAH